MTDKTNGVSRRTVLKVLPLLLQLSLFQVSTSQMLLLLVRSVTTLLHLASVYWASTSHRQVHTRMKVLTNFAHSNWLSNTSTVKAMAV